MNLGSSDMAGSALGTAFPLLLLAYIVQGLQDVEVFHYEKMEAVVGQDAVLPCTVKSSTDLNLVSTEWRKNRNENTKLALYSSSFGYKLFWPNVSIVIENNTAIGSLLHLSKVTKWDSDIYICDLSTFPLGSIRREIELKIKDVEITCDANSTVEVHAGENATIQCRSLPDADYRWLKNEKMVSENESLELLWVSDADAGVYTLTVNTGNKILHKDFIITVLTATTSLRTDLVTVSPQSNVTEPADSSLTTSPTTGPSTTDPNVTWTMSVATDVTDDNPNPSNVTITSGEHISSYTNYTHISVTSSPATHTDPYHFNSSNDQEINPTHTLNTSTFTDQSVASNLSTTLSYGSVAFRSTQRTTNESMLHTVHPEVNSSTSPEESSTLGNITEKSDKPGATPTLSTGNPPTIEDGDTDGVRSHVLVVLIILPVLVLIAAASYLYRKQIIKQRMDLPPPFKPPPPPVKYTTARHREISTQPFPTSRCNSVAESII